MDIVVNYDEGLKSRDNIIKTREVSQIDNVNYMNNALILLESIA